MIEFIEESHTYLADGVIVPSVSKLVNFATGDDYSSIPPNILKQAQEFGIALHEAIDKYLTNGEQTRFGNAKLKFAFAEFFRLKDDYIINPLTEEIITFEGRYAGRFDCLQDDILIDFKTNTKLNIPHLEWQMGFYKMAIKDTLNIDIKKCLCLWLPKGKSGEWVEITPKSKEECLEILNKYEESQGVKELPYE